MTKSAEMHLPDAKLSLGPMGHAVWPSGFGDRSPLPTTINLIGFKLRYTASTIRILHYKNQVNHVFMVTPKSKGSSHDSTTEDQSGWTRGRSVHWPTREAHTASIQVATGGSV